MNKVKMERAGFNPLFIGSPSHFNRLTTLLDLLFQSPLYRVSESLEKDYYYERSGKFQSPLYRVSESLGGQNDNEDY